MNPLRRWWRAFTAWLHDHSDDDCPHCIDMKSDGYRLAREDDRWLQARNEGIERIVRAGFPRTQDDR